MHTYIHIHIYIACRTSAQAANIIAIQNWVEIILKQEVYSISVAVFFFLESSKASSERNFSSTLQL